MRGREKNVEKETSKPNAHIQYTRCRRDTRGTPTDALETCVAITTCLNTRSLQLYAYIHIRRLSRFHIPVLKMLTSHFYLFTYSLKILITNTLQIFIYKVRIFLYMTCKTDNF